MQGAAAGKRNLIQFQVSNPFQKRSKLQQRKTEIPGLLPHCSFSAHSSEKVSEQNNGSEHAPQVKLVLEASMATVDSFKFTSKGRSFPATDKTVRGFSYREQWCPRKDPKRTPDSAEAKSGLPLGSREDKILSSSKTELPADAPHTMSQVALTNTSFHSFLLAPVCTEKTAVKRVAASKDLQQKDSALDKWHQPPSGIWACTCTSEMKGSYSEEHEYHFHEHGQMTGRVTSHFGTCDIRGAWNCIDGSFWYLQIGGDGEKVTGTVRGRVAEAVCMSSAGKVSLHQRSTFVRELKGPKAIPRSKLTGILRKHPHKQPKRNLRVKFPFPPSPVSPSP
jgi:hypothetical protein